MIVVSYHTKFIVLNHSIIYTSHFSRSQDSKEHSQVDNILNKMATLEHAHDLGDTVVFPSQEVCSLVKRAIDKFTSRYDSGWHHIPTAPPVPSYAAAVSGIDPMQVLATLAFVAFLLQSLMALIDRITMTTRVVQARDDQKYEKAEEIARSIMKFKSKKWNDFENKNVN